MIDTCFFLPYLCSRKLIKAVFRKNLSILKNRIDFILYFCAMCYKETEMINVNYVKENVKNTANYLAVSDIFLNTHTHHLQPLPPSSVC